MKAMLDRLEATPPVLFSWAVNVDALRGWSSPFKALAFQEALSTEGMSLLRKETIVFLLGVESKTEEGAANLKKEVTLDMQHIAFLLQLIGIQVEGVAATPTGPGGLGGPGSMAPNRPGGAPPQAPGGGPPQAPQAPQAPGAGPPQAPQGPGTGPPQAPVGGPPGPGGPGQPPRPGGTAGKPANLATAKVEISQKDKVVQVKVDLKLDQKVFSLLLKKAEPYLIRVQGEVEMAIAQPQPHLVGLAGHLYAEKNQQFPLGAFKREATAARLHRPWPPDERVSWLAELLPFMGYEKLYDRISFKHSWKDAENMVPSVSLVSPFLDPRTPRNSWYVRYPGMEYDVATTQIVGIAGIGLDAANYPANDPANADKLGVFGYDRVTRMSDLQNGMAATIMAAQVPPAYKSPWIAGGGSTIRGVPETESVKPFLTQQADGKRGALVMMADGSVRFISEKVSDDVFKTLCTVKGNKKALKLDQVAPLVTPAEEDQAELKAQTDTPGEPKAKAEAPAEPKTPPAKESTPAPSKAAPKVN
jgi:hypothetical protein